MHSTKRLVIAFLLGIISVIAVADSCNGLQPTQGNAYTYCDHGNRVYDDASGHGLAVVPKDSTCGQQ